MTNDNLIQGIMTIRITNRLRAIQAREKRYVSDQTYTSPVTRVIPNFLPSGPYRSWLPTFEKGSGDG